MTGLEILAVLVGCFTAGGVGLALTAIVSERRKRQFLVGVAAHLEAHIDDIESGDVSLPLAFTLGHVRIQAAVRGDVEVWQLERLDRSIASSPIAVVYRGWRAPDARDLLPVADLTSRLLVYADDERSADGLLARAKNELASVLGRSTRRCMVRDGRAFLEVTRRGLAIEDLKDAIVRLDALLTVVAGGDALGLLPPARDAAVAGPSGIPVPALSG